MVRFFEGTVFNANTQALVNTVNCVGVMGAGIALEFMLRYPEMYKDYKEKCEAKSIQTGKLDYFQNSDGSIIINFPTKKHFKYPSKMIWIEQGLEYFVQTYKAHGITSVAFPKLGSNKGRLNWENVKEVMVNYLSPLDIDIYICLDSKENAEGIEKTMLDLFNSYNIDELSDIVKLNKKQKNIIQAKMPYKRFWKIAETESIGIKTYSSIFHYFYEKSLQDSIEYKQSSLDDYHY